MTFTFLWQIFKFCFEMTACVCGSKRKPSSFVSINTFECLKRTFKWKTARRCQDKFHITVCVPTNVLSEDFYKPWAASARLCQMLLVFHSLPQEQKTSKISLLLLVSAWMSGLVSTTWLIIFGAFCISQ